MATPGLKSRSGTPVSDEIIDAISGGVAGQVIRPADPEYDVARRIWNASVDKHPGLIVRCAGAADVVQAVKFARANDILVSIRGGGHNVAGRALSDDGLVIDLSSMRAVFVDPAKSTARVQGGATLVTWIGKLMPLAWQFQRASSLGPALPGSRSAVASAGWSASMA